MLKFLVDESSGRKVAETLLQDGFDAISAIRLMRSAKDKVILKKAVNDDRILITNDKDFGELIYRQRLEHRGVILLRLAIDTPQRRIKVIRSLISRYDERLKRKFVVVTESKVRIRE